MWGTYFIIYFNVGFLGILFVFVLILRTSHCKNMKVIIFFEFLVVNSCIYIYRIFNNEIIEFLIIKIIQAYIEQN